MAARGSTVMQYQTNEVEAEAVKITNAEGLRIDTVLVNGAVSVPVYFNARGTQVGLYRTSDNKMLWGGKLLGDRVVTVTGALVDPDGDDSSWVEFVQAENGSEIHVVAPNFNGVTPRVPGDEPDPNGTAVALIIRAHPIPKWDDTHGSYYNSTIAQVFSSGHLLLEAAETVSIGGSNVTIQSKMMLSGGVPFTVPAGGEVNVSVEFDYPFTLPPNVVQSLSIPGNTGGTNGISCWMSNVTETGASFRVSSEQNSSRTGTVEYIAMGYKL